MNNLNELIELKNYVNYLIEMVLSEEREFTQRDKDISAHYLNALSNTPDSPELKNRLNLSTPEESLLSRDSRNSRNLRNNQSTYTPPVHNTYTPTDRDRDVLDNGARQAEQMRRDAEIQNNNRNSSRAAGRLLVKGGILAGVIGIKTAASMYASHRKKKNWKENGCSNLDAEEKIQCREYLKSIKGK